MKLKRIILGLACLAMLNGSASATTYNLWGGGGTSNLNTGWSYTSSFDANLLFTPLVDVITNATLTLNFLGSNQTFNGGTSYQQTNGGYANGSGYWQTGNTTTYVIDPLDSVKVLIGKKGGQTVTGSDLAGYYSSSVTTSSTPVSATYYTTNSYWHDGYYSYYSCGFFSQCSTYHPGYYTYTSTYYTNTVGSNNTLVNTAGNKGSFSVIANLDSTSLGLLESTGLLRYGFTVTGGGVALESATLAFDAAAPVPEPETYAMLLAGLGLLGFTTYRRKNKNLAA